MYTYVYIYIYTRFFGRASRGLESFHRQTNWRHYAHHRRYHHHQHHYHFIIGIIIVGVPWEGLGSPLVPLGYSVRTLEVYDSKTEAMCLIHYVIIFSQNMSLHTCHPKVIVYGYLGLCRAF